MKIFLSYGHDKFSVIAERLKEDLSKEGYDVWMDSDRIRGGHDWEIKIEEGINDSDWIVLLMTEHSIRRPDGVCLDEISYARQSGKQIAPVMIQEVRPPLCIARIQWVDMLNLVKPDVQYTDEDLYQQRRSQLIAILEGKIKLNHEGGQLSLMSILNPLNNDVYSHAFKKDFCGRQLLLDYFDNWYRSDDKVLWITGNAGMGKTAFIAYLAATRECMAAVHFCRCNDSDRSDSKKAIMSISYYLSTQIPGYGEKIMELPDLHQLDQKSSARLFDYLIVEPLSQISGVQEKIVVAIDALDEATVDCNNELADIVVGNAARTPNWMKFLVTSREADLLMRKMSAYRPISMEDESICNNSQDIKDYLSKKLENLLPEGKAGLRALEAIVEKSQGVFLYAQQIAEDILKGRRQVSDVSRFPEGLTGIYLEYFDRIIGNSKIERYKKFVRPLLEVLCTTYMPIDKDKLEEITGVDEYDVDEALELINELFPIKDGNIEPFHKSIVDWLLDSNRSGQYRVSAKNGHKTIAEFCLHQIETAKQKDKYSFQFVCGHLIACKKDKELQDLYCSLEFWKQRKEAMNIDFLLYRMFVELESMPPELRDTIFKNPGFRNVIYLFGGDIFNKGLFVKLKKNGFVVKLHDDMDDKERMTALRYYYINGDYSIIGDNLEIFECEYKDEELGPQVQNMLGLATKKCGMITQSGTFFKNALRLAIEQHDPLEKIIYYHLNLSRVLTILCQFDEGRKELNTAMDAFFHQDWRSGIQTTDVDFASRQLELAVRYVDVETELFSETYDAEICREEIAWADELYSSKLRRDRYYPRHLQSKVLFMLREHRFDEIDALMDELKESDSAEFDDVRTDYYLSLYQYASGRRAEGLRTAQEQLSKLKKEGTLLIERTELFALVDAMENQSHLSEVSDELKPWYNHTISIIKQIVSC